MIEPPKSPEMLSQEIARLTAQIDHLKRESAQLRKAATILEKDQERYKRLVQFLTDYIYTVTIEDGEVVDTYHGPGCMAITGYNSEDYAADPDLWHRMVHEDDKARVTDQANRALAGAEVPPLVHRIRHRDGSLRWIRNTIVLRKDSYGKVLSYDGLITDITKLKQAELEARQRELQLIQAEKMATLGVLASGIAHEVNNPNNFILLNAQFLLEVWKDTEPVLREYEQENGPLYLAGLPHHEATVNVREMISGIIQGAGRIKKIVNSLSTFSRSDAGDLNRTVEMEAMVESAILIVRSLIRKSTQNFQVDHAPDLPPVKGSSQQLEQVVINLLTNACHALSDPQQPLRVSTYREAESGKVCVAVYDGGCGIPPEQISRIFDPFYTTKRDSEGTGLGLSISYQIVKNHGGELVIESQPGQGTTATVKLPAAEDA